MLYEKETTLYAILNNIRFHHDTCPHIQGLGGRFQTAIREKLEDLEESFPGFMMNFVTSYMKRIRPIISSYLDDNNQGIDNGVKTCRICGMPTSRDVCSFCSIRNRMNSIHKISAGIPK